MIKGQRSPTCPLHDLAVGRRVIGHEKHESSRTADPPDWFAFEVDNDRPSRDTAGGASAARLGRGQNWHSRADLRIRSRYSLGSPGARDRLGCRAALAGIADGNGETGSTALPVVSARTSAAGAATDGAPAVIGAREPRKAAGSRAGLPIGSRPLPVQPR